MEPIIIKQPALSLQGKSILIGFDQMELPAKFWKQAMSDGLFEKLLSNCHSPLGVMAASNCDGNKLRYIIATESNNELNMEHYELPESYYAIFEIKEADNLPEAIKQMWQTIHLWLDQNNLYHLPFCDLEVYPATNQDFMCQIWVPIPNNL